MPVVCCIILLLQCCSSLLSFFRSCSLAFFSLSPPIERSEWQRYCFCSMCVCLSVSVPSGPVSQTSLKRLKLRSSNLTSMFPETVRTWSLKIFRKGTSVKIHFAFSRAPSSFVSDSFSGPPFHHRADSVQAVCSRMSMPAWRAVRQSDCHTMLWKV